MNPITNTIFPVYIYEQGMELPTEGTYYVIAGNGNFLHKETGIVRGIFPVQTVSVLDEYPIHDKADLFCDLPKIPLKHAWRIKEFFRRIVENLRSESEINLYFNKKTGDFKIHIPEQRVSHGGVVYQRVALTHHKGMEDYLRVGTIHSHCDFGAFHSGIDINDENDFDGIHITFGNNDRSIFTITASIVINGYRKMVDPLSVIEGIESKGGEDYGFVGLEDATITEWSLGIDEWESMVSYNSYTTIPNFSPGNKVSVHRDFVRSPDLQKIGDGPFKVINCVDEMVTINTDIGELQINQKFLKKEVMLS